MFRSLFRAPKIVPVKNLLKKFNVYDVEFVLLEGAVPKFFDTEVFDKYPDWELHSSMDYTCDTKVDNTRTFDELTDRCQFNTLSFSFEMLMVVLMKYVLFLQQNMVQSA